ncbi:MAG: hypothetical protein AUH31_03085 [Armatimonadetes bacterium 13_1_40CM_64_14]|nr:MAG: hypothetical protein AUH31_03085 [Armatimonadetes bacterium 13_1_40CM_64_14]
MRAWSGSVRLIVLGGTVLLTSWFLLLLLAIRLLPPSLLLALLAYAGSVAGLAIGVFGAVRYAHPAGRV